jgi:hypothetical protein
MLFSPTYRHSFGSAGTAETLARRDRPRILTVTSSLAKGNPDLVIRSATTVQLLAKSELILLSIDYRREFRRSSWAACIKRIYEVDPLECPKCKAQMRIIAFIQDEHSIKEIMKSQGIADFRAPPSIPKFIDTSHAIDELSSYDSFEPTPDDF